MARFPTEARASVNSKKTPPLGDRGGVSALGTLRKHASEHDIQMSRLATTITIPVMSTAKQENSTRSLRSICILPPPLTFPRAGVTMTSQVIALGLMPDTGTITNYFAQVRRLWCPVSGDAVGHLRQIDTLPTPSACPLCPAKADK